MFSFFWVIIAFIAELLILAPKIKLEIGIYVKEIIPRIASVAIVASGISMGSHYLLPSSKWTLFIIVPVSIISVIGGAYLFGTSRPEKEMVRSFIFKLKNK